MRKLYFLFLNWILVVLSVLFFENSYGQLKGMYTINPAAPNFNANPSGVSGKNYTSFSNAILALTNYGGISGSVIFEVSPGTYDEQITIHEITGTSSASTITFLSETRDCKDVILKNAPTVNNWVINLDGADFITFSDLTISNYSSTSLMGTVIKLSNGSNACNNISFENNILNGVNTNDASPEYSVISQNSTSFGQSNNLIIKGNEINYGSIGINLIGLISPLESGIIIDNNIIENFFYVGIQAQNQDAIKVRYNSIRGRGTGGSVSNPEIGISMIACNNATHILKNKIQVKSSGYNCGIKIADCLGTTGAEFDVTNNMVAVTAGNNTSYGVLNTGTSSNCIFIYNTIKLSSIDVTACVFKQIAPANAKNRISNNIFLNSGGGKVFDFNSNATGEILVCNNNNAWTNGSTFGNIGATNYIGFSNWQASGYDVGSLNKDIVFTSSANLHLVAADASLKLPNALPSAPAIDIDDNMRSAPYYIGCDEYSTNQSLSGYYTIDKTIATDFPVGRNFISFTEAINALTLGGITSPVIFDVVSNIYTEQISIPHIPGSGFTNTITFRSATKTATDVTLKEAPTSNNWIIRLNGADNIRFQYITVSNESTSALIGRVIFLDNTLSSTDDIILDGCNLNGRLINDPDDAYAVIFNNSFAGRVPSKVHITSCTIKNGSYGIYLIGLNSPLYSFGTKILKNTIKNFYFQGIYLTYHDNPKIVGNQITGAGTYTDEYGINIQYCRNDILISKNKIILSAASKATGIWDNWNISTALNQEFIVNNFISILNAATTVSGITSGSGDYINIYYNSIHLVNAPNNGVTATSNYGLTVYNTNSNVKNNIVACPAGAVAVRYPSTGQPVSSDYNNFHSSGTVLGLFNGASYAKLKNWISTTGFDANSYSFMPFFVSTTDLHSAGRCVMGTNVGIDLDIDNKLRHTVKPKIGADEYPAATMNGSYDIGVGKYFETFNDAINNMKCIGVFGPVTFIVYPGTYDEQISIPQISGASQTNTITFKSSTGTNTDVILSNAPSANNWIIRFDGADYIRFYNMTISNLNTYTTPSTLGNVIVFDNTLSNTKNNIIEGNVINGIVNPTLGDHNIDVISQSIGTNLSEFNEIRNNTINYGFRSISFWGANVTEEKGNIIEYNILKNYNNQGIQVKNNEDISIKGNTLTGLGTVSGIPEIAVRLSNLKNNSVIENNKIFCFNSGSNYGINMSSMNTTGTAPIVIKNNMISITGGTGDNFGIYIETDSKLINIYYNSVYLSTSSSTTSSALQVDATITGANFKIENNIFANIQGGYAISLPINTDILSCNYNDLYATGTNLGKYNSFPQTTLANWIANSGLDANSLFVVPNFTATDNLYLNADNLSLTVPHKIIGITTDIDGENRNSISPYVGANEHNTLPPPVAPTDLVAFATSVSQINLYWKDIATDETNYILERSTNNFTSIEQTFILAANTSSYVDNSALVLGKLYYYRVKTDKAGYASLPSSVKTAIPRIESGNCLYFNGANNWVDLSSSVGVFSGLTTGTISGWFNSADPSTGALFSISEDNAADNNRMTVYTNNNTGSYLDESFSFKIKNAGIFQLIMHVRKGNAFFTDGNWHHFAVVIDGINNKIYIDGVDQPVTFEFGNATTAAFTNITNPNSIRIGDQRTSLSENTFFKGYIDELALWNRPLTAIEINTNFKDIPIAGNANGLIALYHFDETQHTPILWNSTKNNINGNLITAYTLINPENNFNNSRAMQPAAPLNLIVNADVNSAGMIWNANTESDFDKYNIIVSVNADLTAPVFTISNTNISDVTEIVTGLNPSTLYYFGVCGVDLAGQIGDTTIVSQSTLAAIPWSGFGNALAFDGVDDKLIIPNRPILNPGNGNFTIEAWINVPANDQSRALIQKVEPLLDQTQYSIWINGDDAISIKDDPQMHRRRICFNYIESISLVQRNCFTKRDIIDGKWHHIACVADKAADKLRIFVDGIEEEVSHQNTGVWPNITNLDHLQIFSDDASLPVGSRFTQGMIDELRIWNSARTNLEIQDNMNKILTGAEANLVLYFHFDQFAGTGVKDFTSNLNFGFLSGNPLWKSPGAPFKFVTKKSYLHSGKLFAYSPNAETLTFSMATPPTQGTFNLTNNLTGEFTYQRNAYAKDSIRFKVTNTSSQVSNTYTLEFIPVLNTSGRIVSNVNSKIWIADTVSITGHITIGADTTLTILPDTYVQINNPNRIIVKGNIQSIGTATQNIIYSASDSLLGWGGIEFKSNDILKDSSRFIYNKFKFGQATGTGFDGDGGAIMIYDYSKIRIVYSTFYKNYALANGGALFFQNSSPVVSQNTFTFNQAGLRGGAMEINGNSSTQVIRNIFAWNKATDGGAVSLAGYNMKLINNFFVNNLATQHGGAVYCGFNNTSPYIFQSNLITNNSAGTAGGAIGIDNCTLNTVNTTLANNTSPKGGAIYLLTNATINSKNDIQWGNISPQGSQTYNSIGSFANISYSDIQNGLGEIVGGGTTTYLNNISIDPVFVLPEVEVGNINGAAAANWSLQNTSPCINKGDPSTDISANPFDLINNARIALCRIDLGAYEIQAYTLPGYSVVWIGCSDSNWHNPTNWSTGAVPTAADNVLIQGTNITTFQPSISANAFCNSIAIDTNQGAKVTIAIGFSLQITQ